MFPDLFQILVRKCLTVLGHLQGLGVQGGSLDHKAISENRETAAILKKAISRLEKYYMPNTTTLTQTKAKQEPGARLAAPPPKPSDYQKSGGAGVSLQRLNLFRGEKTIKTLRAGYPAGEPPGKGPVSRIPKV